MAQECAAAAAAAAAAADDDDDDDDDDDEPCPVLIMADHASKDTLAPCARQLCGV